METRPAIRAAAIAAAFSMGADGALAAPAGAPELDVSPCLFANLTVTPPSYSGCGDPAFDELDERSCPDLGSDPVAGPAFVWVMLSERDSFPGGIGGLQIGVEYEGVDVSGWSLCTGGTDIPDATWPGSGSGDAMTWAGGCHDVRGTSTRVGYFTVKSGDTGTMRLTADPRIEATTWAECDTRTFVVPPGNLGGGDLSVGTIPICVSRTSPESAPECAIESTPSWKGLDPSYTED